MSDSPTNTEITSLVIKVESVGATKSTEELARLEAQGIKTEKAVDSLGKTSTDASGAMVGSATSAARVGESAEQASARIQKMVQASLARRAAEVEAQAAERTAIETSREAATAAEVTIGAYQTQGISLGALRDAYAQYDAIIARTAKTETEVAAQWEALTALMQANLITTQEEEAAINALTATEAKLGLAMDVAAGDMEKNTLAMIQNRLAAGSTVREYTALADEIIAGRFSRLPGTISVLSNRLGIMQLLFSSTGLAILGTAAAVGTFIGILVKGEEEQQRYNVVMQRTGGYLGVTEGQYRSAAASIASLNETLGAAKDALDQVANTGEFTGSQLVTVSKAALDFSRVTGESVKNAVGEFSKLAKDPLKATEDLNRQYHYLTASVYDQIVALQEQGRQEAAARVAIDALSTAMDRRVQNLTANEGIIQRYWEHEKRGWSELWNSILHVASSDTLDQQLAATQERIASIRSQLAGKPNEVLTQKQVDSLNVQLAAAESARDDLQIKIAQAKKQAEITAEVDKQQALYARISDDVRGRIAQLDKETSGERELLAIEKERQQLTKIATDTSNPQGLRDSAKRLLDLTNWDRMVKVEQVRAANETIRLDRATLSQLESDEGIAYQDRLAYEIKFWEGKLAAATKGTIEYGRIYQTLQQLEKQQQDSRDKDVNALRTRLNKEEEAVNSSYSSQYGALLNYENKKRDIELQYERDKAQAAAATGLNPTDRNQLEVEAAKVRNDRLAALDRERNAMQLDAASQLYGSLASITESFGGKQSAAYKVLFGISKGYAIAESILNIQTGISKAIALGWPQNLPVIAEVVGEGAQIIATIKGTNYAGNFDLGGNIPGGKWGIAGEFGPEVVRGPAQIISRKETQSILAGGRSSITYAPVITMDNRGAGPDELAKFYTARGQLRRQLHADIVHFNTFGYFPD